MMKFTRYPVALSLILGLILVASLSFVASLYTLWMTTVLSGDATAVNISGSLRMQSFRIAYAIERNAPETEIDSLITEFHARLTSSALKGHIPEDQPELTQLFTSIEQQFSQLRKDAQSNPLRFLAQVEDFVTDIDRLVVLLENWSESKISRLQTQQIVITLLSLLAATLFALVIFNRVITPLQALIGTVLRIGRGDRHARADYARDDEFGELAGTLNQMANEIADVHDSLESKIEEQTRELSRNNHILEFLFNLSQQLSTEKPDITHLKEQALEDLRRLCPEQSIHWQSKYFASEDDCFVVRCEADSSYLICQQKDSLAEWQNRILMTVADLFSNAINRMGAYNSENRIALLNERSSIARELHDSLAQQLSYLKIQVVRLVKLRERHADEQTLNEIIEELREGLNSSYRKLRELLVTFRFHLDEPGLVPSVQVTADEINRISPNTKVHLYIDEDWPQNLSPSQDIHCLHVIREALTNVIKHAHADNAVVSLKVLQDGQLEIKINDDGIGFTEPPGKPMHYGLDIMSERAGRIDGTINYQSLKHGGAGVTLTFPLTVKEDTL